MCYDGFDRSVDQGKNVSSNIPVLEYTTCLMDLLLLILSKIAIVKGFLQSAEDVKDL